MRLDEICTINMGQSPASSTYNEDCNGLPFFQGNADFGEIHPSVRIWCSEPTKVAQRNDILLSVRAPIGALNIANEKCCIGRGLAALTVDTSLCDQKFLWYALSSKVDELNAKGTGSTFKAINKNSLAETEINLPPLEKQRRIAAVLDKVTDLIAQRRAQLNKLDLLVKSRFVEMFGDPSANQNKFQTISLGSIANVGSSKRIFEKEYVDDGVPFYRTKEIVELSKGHKITTELFITRERYNEIRKQYGVPKKGDLLVTAVGTIGTIWIVDGKTDFYYKDGNLLHISVPDTIDSIYLKEALEKVINLHKTKMSAGTAYAALTISALKEIKICNAPVLEQQAFSEYVCQCQRLKLTIRKSLDKLEIIKKAIMQQYFG